MLAHLLHMRSEDTDAPSYFQVEVNKCIGTYSTPCLHILRTEQLEIPVVRSRDHHLTIARDIHGHDFTRVRRQALQ